MIFSRRKELLIFVSGLIAVALAVLVFWTSAFPINYQSVPAEVAEAASSVSHVATPYPVRAIYMTQCVAGEKNLRNKLVDLVSRTELNSIVIDLKDYSGRIAFFSDTPILKNKTSSSCNVPDMKEFVKSLHEKGIYLIARVTTFQDPFFAKERPDLAVKKNSDKSVVWKDRKGISYIDPDSTEAWNYILTIAKEAHDSLGFDEINFDYIRFPSDGNMSDIYFPFSNASLKADPKGGKAAVLKNFYQYVSREMKQDGAVISADLFGMTTTNTDDLNIGQVLEDAVANFDFVAPMVYPSHYPSGFHGLSNPAASPYEVIKFSMDAALKRASTTPLKLRPWLQDFNLGSNYTAAMIRKEKQAVYDTGLQSWMMWNAANVYTAEALDPKVPVSNSKI